MKRGLWIGALLLVVLVVAWTYTYRREPTTDGSAQGADTDATAAAVEQAPDDSQAGAADDGPSAVTAELVDMRRGTSLDLPLEQDRVSALVSNVGRATLPLLAERSVCDVQVRLVSGGQTREWSGVLFAHELRSTDPSLPFQWVVWSWRVTVNFRAVSTPGPVSYAAWVEGQTLCFEEIRAARDHEAALMPLVSQARWREDGTLMRESQRLPNAAATSFPEGAAVTCISVHGSLGSEDFAPGRRRSTAGLDIRTESIERDAAGHWTVKVTGGRRPKKVYTFVSPDGITWERK